MRCYHCSATQSEHYAEENGYTLVRCSACGLVYLVNPPALDERADALAQGLHKGETTIRTTGRYRWAAVKRYQQILGELYGKELGENLSWLDIGCGHGEFMEALFRFAPAPLNVTGSEPNIHKRRSARLRGLDVRLIDLDAHDKHYDCISLLNVYSHLPDPPAFLRKVREMLNPGGELLLETGDTARFTSREHPRPFFLPDHLSFASEEIVTAILHKSGFEIITVKKYRHPDFRLSPAAFLKELAKFFLPSYRSRLSTIFSDARRYAATDMYIRARRSQASSPSPPPQRSPTATGQICSDETAQKSVQLAPEDYRRLQTLGFLHGLC